MVKIVISSGHGLYVRGAHGIIDEVDEAREVVKAVAFHLREMGAEVVTYHDDVSTSQSENLERITDFHNSCGQRDLDISVHFNAYEQTDQPRGTETLFVTQSDLADNMSSAIAVCSGLIDRGPKHRDDLYFLNNTDAPAILIEIAFVDSEADVAIYHAKFEEICRSIAEIVSGNASEQATPQLFNAAGPCSWFGGPDDQGVDADEDLAFIYEVDDAPHLFLDEQPAGTTGLARRLDPSRPYVACRWDYEVTPKTMLADPHHIALIRAPKTGRTALAWPADWGPHESTGRVADLSPRLLDQLGLTTDDDVEVVYPVRRTRTV